MAIGIIAEYNPFHAGHAHQLAAIKKIRDEEIVAVMSGSFTQRGEPTILDKWIRAKLAVLSGVDLVIELPFLYAVRSAQDFARGAINILENLGVIDTLAFSAEFSDLNTLKKVASVDISTKIREKMSQGISYAAAATQILSNATEISEKLLRKPNTILAIEYLRALPKTITPILIKRVGSYEDLRLQGKFSSASSIRAAVKKFLPPWEKIADCVSSETHSALRSEKISGLVDEKFLYRSLRIKLLTSRAEDLQKIYGMTEGLEFRLLNAQGKDFSDLVSSLSSKRYTTSRIRRLLLYFLLDVTKNLIAEVDGMNYARVLAFNERGRQLLRKISSPIITKLIKILNRRDFSEQRRSLIPQQKLLMMDVLATDLRSLLYENPRPMRQDFCRSPIYIR